MEPLEETECQTSFITPTRPRVVIGKRILGSPSPASIPSTSQARRPSHVRRPLSSLEIYHPEVIVQPNSRTRKWYENIISLSVDVDSEKPTEKELRSGPSSKRNKKVKNYMYSERSGRYMFKGPKPDYFKRLPPLLLQRSMRKTKRRLPTKN